MSRVCANCRRTLGELETEYWWGEHAVCLPCYQSLSQQHVAAVSGTLHADAAAEAADHVDFDAPSQVDYGTGVCAACGGEFAVQEMTIDEAGQTVCATCDMAAAARRAQAKTARRSGAAASAYKARPPKKKSSAVPWAVAATVAVLAGGGTAYYYLRPGAGDAAKPVGSVAPKDAAPVGPPTPEIGWQGRLANLVLEGNRLESVGKFTEAGEQWKQALAQFPDTITAEQTAQRDRIQANVARMAERATRGAARASEKRGVWGFGGPYVAYNRIAPDPVIPAAGTGAGGPLFNVPKVAAPATAPTSAPAKGEGETAKSREGGGGDKTEMASADKEKGMDMMDKSMSGKGGGGKGDAMMDKGMDKSMEKGMEKSMEKGMDGSMEGGMGKSKGGGDSSSSSAASAKNGKAGATSKPGDAGQNLFGNAAAKLGMNSRRGKAAVANPDVKLTDEQQAMLLLDEGQSDEAAKAFETVLTRDPRSVLAHDALGCLEMMNNHRPEAKGHFERAYEIKSGDRVAAIDLAALTLDDGPERAVRLIRTYLSTPGLPLDEQAQNALGTALSRCGSKSDDRAYLLECRDFYLRYDQRLNQARTDGMKRWGPQWVDAATAEAKWAALLGPGYGLEKAEQEYPKLSATRKQAWDGWQRATRNVVTAGQVELAKQNFESASKAEEEIVGRIRQFDQELDKAEAPKFTPAIEMVLPQ